MSSMSKFLFGAFSVLLCGWPLNSQGGKPVADLIFHNGSILTGETLEAGHPTRVSALAIQGGMIIATGTDHEILNSWRGSNTEVVDLHEQFALPGLNDAHVHLASAGFEKLNLDLLGVKSPEEMNARISTRAKGTPAGEWIVGRGWDHTLWGDKRLPSRMDLDKVTEGHPAIFTRVDGHIAVANSAALAAAGIGQTTTDPPGGKFDRTPGGALTGIVRENAVQVIYAHVPPPNKIQRRTALQFALEDAASHGVTSVQDNSTWDDFLVLEQMEREGMLPIRVTEWLPFEDPLDVLERHRVAHGADDPMLHTGMLKGFMDGSLGSRTAALFAPYADDPGNSGIPLYDQIKLNQMTVERAKAGFQIGFHAIGDRAVGMALSAFAAAEEAGYGRNSRFRIEHAQVVASGDFERFRELGVIGSMQPNHLLTDMRWAGDRIGPERMKTSYAWKSFLDHGVPLAFGTDYPVEPITPFRGLYAAVTRKNETRTQEYVPGERLTIHQAIAAYTKGSAYAEFAERSKGKLAPGYFADFIVLDRDIVGVSPQNLLQTKVLRTVVGGKTVWQAE